MEKADGAIWFHKIGVEGTNSFVKRMIQGIFVGHHDRTRAIFFITKSGIVRGKSRKKQTLSDAWESTIWEDLFDNAWHMVITETRLTKKFIIDEEGAGLPLPIMLVEKSLEIERGRFYVLLADIEAHGHMGSFLGYALLTSQGKATKPRRDEFREGIRTTIEKTLTGEARIDTCKDRIAETERVRERRRTRVERGAGMCLWNLGTKMMSRWRFDMRTHLAVAS